MAGSKYSEKYNKLDRLILDAFVKAIKSQKTFYVWKDYASYIVSKKKPPEKIHYYAASYKTNKPVLESCKTKSLPGSYDKRNRIYECREVNNFQSVIQKATERTGKIKNISKKNRKIQLMLFGNTKTPLLTREAMIKKFSYPGREYVIEEILDRGHTINPDGTMVLYHATTRNNAEKIKADGLLKTARDAPDNYGIYLSTSPDVIESYGDGTLVKIQVRARDLNPDDVFPNDRIDFQVNTRQGIYKPVKIMEILKPKPMGIFGFNMTDKGRQKIRQNVFLWGMRLYNKLNLPSDPKTEAGKELQNLSYSLADRLINEYGPNPLHAGAAIARKVQNLNWLDEQLGKQWDIENTQPEIKSRKQGQTNLFGSISLESKKRMRYHEEWLKKNKPKRGTPPDWMEKGYKPKQPVTTEEHWQRSEIKETPQARKIKKYPTEGQQLTLFGGNYIKAPVNIWKPDLKKALKRYESGNKPELYMMPGDDKHAGWQFRNTLPPTYKTNMFVRISRFRKQPVVQMCVLGSKVVYGNEIKWDCTEVDIPDDMLPGYPERKQLKLFGG